MFQKNSLPLHPQSRKAQRCKQKGALVQLVRIHACHAWGHGFESRTHRQLSKQIRVLKHLASGLFGYMPFAFKIHGGGRPGI